MTNFYPPFEIGGQEQVCYELVQALEARGYQVSVLTSTHGIGKASIENSVYRLLMLEMEFGSPLHYLRFFLQRRKREQQTLDQFKRVVETIQPEIIFIWGMWNLPRSLPALAEKLYPGRVLYRFGDYWPSMPNQFVLFLNTPGNTCLKRVMKSILRNIVLNQLNKDPLPAQLEFEKAYCNSEGMRQILIDRGVPISHARVIHNGVDLQVFKRFDKRSEIGVGKGDLKLLYAGRVDPEKGVHTVIRALDILINQNKRKNLTLTIVGPGVREYLHKLDRLISQYNLENYILFRDAVSREAMPALLNEFDALLFPSIIPEPFGRIIIEAMACELVVVCTPVGGVPEIVTDEYDGLYFTPENPSELASQIERLMSDSSLIQRLQESGRQTVEQRFSIKATLEQIEAYLQEIVSM